MGTLTIRSAQPDDAGTYVCTGSDYDYHNDTDIAILIVTGQLLTLQSASAT